MACLSKAWFGLVFKNYGWAEIPKGDHLLPSDIAAFVDKFEQLGGLAVPDFPFKLLSPSRLSLLTSADSFGFSETVDLLSFAPLFDDQETVSKLSNLSVRVGLQQKEDQKAEALTLLAT